MPQFDIFVFFNQALWVFIVFWIFHIVTLKNLLVPIIKILKMRSKLFKYSQKIKEQQQNNLDNIKELDKPNKKKLCIYIALYSRAFAVITKKLLEDLKKKEIKIFIKYFKYVSTFSCGILMRILFIQFLFINIFLKLKIYEKVII